MKNSGNNDQKLITYYKQKCVNDVNYFLNHVKLIVIKELNFIH